MKTVGAVWKHLERERPTGPGWYSRRLLPGSPCPIYAAISGDTFNRAVIVEVDSVSIPPDPVYPSAQGFVVTPVMTSSGPRRITQLVLALIEPSYSDVFEALADNVVETVGAAPSEQEGVQVFLATLRMWQEFMRKHGALGLSIEAQIGLVAELLFLERHLLAELTPARAIDAWTGPGGGVHDFVVDTTCVEVKGSVSSPPLTFNVPNLVQLDETRVGTLLLCHLTLTPTPAGKSLPEIVDGIRAQLTARNAPACRHFDQRLLEAGYLESQRAMYESRKLQVKRVRFYEVRNGFPRLRAQDVPLGIADCAYAVELSACSSFQIEKNGLGFTLVR